MKNIEIITTQNVLIEYQLATVVERILAFVIDAIVIALMVYFWSKIVEMGSFSMQEDHFLQLFLLSFLPLIFTFAYFLLMEGFTGQTLGKKALGIKVVRLDGQEPALSDYAIRTLFHLIDTMFSGGFLAIVTVAMSAKSQRIGDWAANTSVVKLAPSIIFNLQDILKIDTLDNYTPVFPQVIQLKEKDMLLVKNILTRYRNYQNEAHATIVNQAAAHIQQLLDVKQFQGDSIAFLNTVLKDYIVLTR